MKLKNAKKDCFNYYNGRCKGTTCLDCSECNFYQSDFFFNNRLAQRDKWLKDKEIYIEDGKVMCRKRV